MNRRPTPSIVANGIAIYQGSVGTALTFTSGNQARFTRSRLATTAPGVHTALRAGPRLVDQGRLSQDGHGLLHGAQI